MTTESLHTPSFLQKAKKFVDGNLFKLSKSVGSKIVAKEYLLEAAKPPVINKPPTNLETVPERFLERFTRPTPCPAQIIYQLKDACVAWHGTVVKGLRVFVPSLPYPFLEPEYGGLFLLRQFKSHSVSSITGPVGLVFDQWSIGNYYHWIAEALPRLALLRRIKPNCLILLPGPNPPMYMTRTVKALGFHHTYVMSTKEMLNVADLYVPAMPGMYGCMMPEFVQEVRQAILEDLHKDVEIVKVPKRRVYVSRSMQKWRQLTNEAQLIELLKYYNFEVVFFEEMTFIEQVSIMQETEIFLTIHGANVTNCLFLPLTSKVIEILSEDYINPSYLYMANSIGLDYYSIPGTLCLSAQVPSSYANMTVDIRLVEECLQGILNQNAIEK